MILNCYNRITSELFLILSILNIFMANFYKNILCNFTLQIICGFLPTDDQCQQR